MKYPWYQFFQRRQLSRLVRLELAGLFFRFLTDHFLQSIILSFTSSVQPTKKAKARSGAPVLRRIRRLNVKKPSRMAIEWLTLEELDKNCRTKRIALLNLKIRVVAPKQSVPQYNSSAARLSIFLLPPVILLAHAKSFYPSCTDLESNSFH